MTKAWSQTLLAVKVHTLQSAWVWAPSSMDAPVDSTAHAARTKCHQTRCLWAESTAERPDPLLPTGWHLGTGQGSLHGLCVRRKPRWQPGTAFRVLLRFPGNLRGRSRWELVSFLFLAAANFLERSILGNVQLSQGVESSGTWNKETKKKFGD